MKNKIIISVLSVMIFTIIVVSGLFIAINNYQSMQNVKNNLILNNEVLLKFLDEPNVDYKTVLFNKELEKIDIRITYISKDGNVLFDSQKDSESLENHSSRIEFMEALKNGEGSSTRYSESLKKEMIYYATRLSNGNIIRSAVSIDTIKYNNKGYAKYYFLVLVVVIALSILLTSRLTGIILTPINQLQFITSRMARGELHRRVTVNTNDEIGQLGRTFNYMAEMLQLKINESTDKQNRIEAILKSMDSGVVAVDTKHRIIIMNPYAKKIFGIQDDIIGKNLMDHIRDFELDSIFDNNDNNFKEIKILWPQERDLRIKTADILNNGSLIGTVAVIQDITDIKKLEHMRTQFVANVSHELKTPLTSIKGFAETLKFVKDEEKKQKFLDIINDEAERLTRLINDILTLSSIEQNINVVEEEFSVNDVINNVILMMRSAAETKDIELKATTNDKVNLVGDSDKFKQMMINLIENGIKYSEKGAHVDINTIIKDDNLILEVEDSGYGIPESDITRIFERFYRVDKARSRANGGTGLGLAIVKHIVIGFNGSIKVDSTIGVGSKFTITLPIRGH
ncbi:PAS/PAC sensor signal transduction histidine kinase [Clostridium amylolyticum]|uniref:histidine kinase n=1 Tax=Clostridium amylolyticum TaxID=1121298 RepID=A0A1M6D2S9_9CLOT|nr:ATP-binding protein [Clostridium amylolyticum]SHI67562.1 PAS/PAC sensor signal transduction histidine kinase [Clostridium amylolyticum]